jgi:hypothetical protein
MSEKKEASTEWMQKLWRPAMGWMYMLICLLDMAVFPVCWSLLQAMMHMPITQWNPLTLQGAGLFHIAMGAVLGISAFGRTQEKLAGTAANPTATSQTITNNQNMSGNVAGGFGSGSMPLGGNSMSTGGFGGASTGFGGTSNGFNSQAGGAPAFGASATGFGAPTSGFGAPTPASTGGGFGGGGFGSTPPAPAFGTTSTAPSTGINTPTVNAKGQKVVPQDDQPVL